MSIYECCYIQGKTENHVESKFGISAFIDGFWLDKKYKLAIENCTEPYIWIPPSRIEYVIIKEKD